MYMCDKNICTRRPNVSRDFSHSIYVMAMSYDR